MSNKQRWSLKNIVNSVSEDSTNDIPDIVQEKQESEFEKDQMELKSNVEKLTMNNTKIESNQTRIYELEEKIKNLENMMEESFEKSKQKNSITEANLAFLGLKTKIQQKLITNLLYENDLKRKDIQHLPILNEKQWEFVNFYDVPTSNLNCHRIKDLLIFYGGKKNSNEIRIYNFKKLQWEYTKITDFPRCNYTSQVINDEIYIIGGKDKYGRSCSSVIKIIIEDWIIEEMKISKKGPGEIHSHSSIVKDNKILIFGGVETIHRTLSKNEERTSDKLFEFDPQTSSWNLIETIGKSPKPCKNHSTVYSKEFDAIVTFGGEYWDEKYDKYKCSNDTCEFDFRTFTWKQPISLGKNPSPRFGHASFISNDLMFIFGGFEMGNTLKNDLYQYDLENKFWTEIELPMPPSPRMFCCSLFLENELNLFGGIDANGNYFSDGYSLLVKISEQEVPVPNISESKKLINLRKESRQLVDDLKNMEEVYNEVLLK